MKKDHQKEHPTVAIKLLLFGGDKLLKQKPKTLVFYFCLQRAKEKIAVLYLQMNVNTVDPWTTQVWTALVHFKVNLLIVNTTALQPVVVGIRACGTVGMEEPRKGRTNEKLHADFWLCGGLVTLIPAMFNGQLYLSTIKWFLY